MTRLGFSGVVFLGRLRRAEASQEVGLDPFYEGNMEPWGAVCVGYVKQVGGAMMSEKTCHSVNGEADRERKGEGERNSNREREGVLYIDMQSLTVEKGLPVTVAGWHLFLSRIRHCAMMQCRSTKPLGVHAGLTESSAAAEAGGQHCGRCGRPGAGQCWCSGFQSHFWTACA